MKQVNGVRCALIIFALAALGGCGGNTAVTTVPAETSVQTTSEMTTGSTPETTPETTPEATEKQTAEPITEEYDRLGHGIAVKGCEYKELEYSSVIDEQDDERNRLLNEFVSEHLTAEVLPDGMGYKGVNFGGYTSYDFDCDGRDEYIISMTYESEFYVPVISCLLYYMEDDGSAYLLHNAAYQTVDLWDFDGLVLFQLHPDFTNGIYGGDSKILRAFDGEAPTFVFSSHGEETRFVEESGYIYDYAGHMNGPYYAVVTPELEFLWITRDDLTTDDIMECAKTDTYITDWLNEHDVTADDVLEAFTIGHLDYCIRIKSDREYGSWYTLSSNGAWEGMQSYISDTDEYYIGKQAKAVHGIDLKKLNIIK